ncbi:hypothetical protein BO86DRAFT_120130 [Aspergillus japonicus CBS 114.51]|uniref:Uncharacterized protein n=1 Tax=Aspergillus japonicus CBS 114.51 TaxID=1448312 RepID=A0A8T8WZI3_ASPJA|nr:hypothetical protein BO86DRAFT_120130 [Aspergillus japonicus CBS 114.51]RAH80802.1 hypothetical protein BO86DRAFT_120130 [Aspergillus japonicus CBS 114.51]
MSIAVYVEENAPKLSRTLLEDERYFAKPIRKICGQFGWLSQLGTFPVDSGQVEPRRKIRKDTAMAGVGWQQRVYSLTLWLLHRICPMRTDTCSQIPGETESASAGRRNYSSYGASGPPCCNAGKSCARCQSKTYDLDLKLPESRKPAGYNAQNEGTGPSSLFSNRSRYAAPGRANSIRVKTAGDHKGAKGREPKYRPLRNPLMILLIKEARPPIREEI